MKKQFLILFMIFFLTSSGYSQNLRDELIRLAKFYKNFSSSNSPSKESFEQLSTITSPELKTSIAFIAELSKKNNAITTTPFLTRPDSMTLRYLYVIRAINYNLFEAEPKDNDNLIDSLNAVPTSTYEQLACYYGMVFASVGNKNLPLNLSAVNFTLDNYGLKDDTEKGVFFLKSMDTFGTIIWGYMNIVKPPNYDKALHEINNYPRYNGQPYYQFQDLNFQDFKLTIDKRKPKQSFKKYYINKYLNTLLYHSLCLGQKKKTKKEQQAVMMGSIMINESYYKFSDHPEVFRQLFQKVSKD